MSDKVLLNKPKGLSTVTAAFLQHQAFLKKFLARYLYSGQDIEDVA